MPLPLRPTRSAYGDNLEILRRCIDEESVNLIYLDPPFNCNADYNVLFAEKDDTPGFAGPRPDRGFGTIRQRLLMFVICLVS